MLLIEWNEVKKQPVHSHDLITIFVYTKRLLCRKHGFLYKPIESKIINQPTAKNAISTMTVAILRRRSKHRVRYLSLKLLCLSHTDQRVLMTSTIVTSSYLKQGKRYKNKKLLTTTRLKSLPTSYARNVSEITYKYRLYILNIKRFITA